MTGLLEFLRAHLDEDEQIARGPHIARHDPARVLAELAAKRAIIDLCAVPDPHDLGEGCPDCLTLPHLATARLHQAHRSERLPHPHR